MADTTQPAGALPEHPWMPTPIKSSPEEWAARAKVKAKDAAGALPERDIFGVAIDYATQILAMMAERDAARAERDAALERAEFCLAFTRDAQALCATAQAEAAALRRELEELRKAGAPMANTMFNLAQRDSMPAHERESFKSMQVAWDAAPRAIPPDAREGREPLTDDDWQAIADDCDRIIPSVIRQAVMRRLAGTSADGETQP